MQEHARHELLLKYFLAALTEIDAHIKDLTELAEIDRTLDEAAAPLDLGASGKQILNHVVAYSRSCDSAVNRLNKMKDPPRPRSGRGPDPVRGSTPAETETRAPTKDVPAGDPAPITADVTTETPPASPPADTRRTEPPVETMSELSPPTELPPTVDSTTEPEVRSDTSRPISNVEPAIEPEAPSDTSGPISRVEPATEPEVRSRYEQTHFQRRARAGARRFDEQTHFRRTGPRRSGRLARHNGTGSTDPGVCLEGDGCETRQAR